MNFTKKTTFSGLAAEKSLNCIRVETAIINLLGRVVFSDDD
jgi:hypothetical protein